MAAKPLDKLNLRCGSVAEHLGFAALADVAVAKGTQDCRVIGGHMIALHVLRWNLNLSRATQDVDLGVTPVVAQSSELSDELERLGYSRSGGNRFQKHLVNLPTASDDNNAVIDLLVPSYTSRARPNRRFGEHLVTTEVPGLAMAFKRKPVDLQVKVLLLDGSKLSFPVRLPDEIAALTLKIMARTVRREDRDAVDVWRALEICAVAGIRNIDFGPDEQHVRQVLKIQFGRGGDAIREIERARNLSETETTRMETRVQAPIEQALP